MITPKQEKLAKAIALNRTKETPDTLTTLLRNAGYSESSSTHSQKLLITGKGVQEFLTNLGFNEEAAKATISQLLFTGREENRLKAAQEIFKVKGTYAPEKRVSINFFSDLAKEIENEQQSATPDADSSNDGGGTEKEIERPILEIEQPVLDQE